MVISTWYKTRLQTYNVMHLLTNLEPNAVSVKYTCNHNLYKVGSLTMIIKALKVLRDEPVVCWWLCGGGWVGVNYSMASIIAWLSKWGSQLGI